MKPFMLRRTKADLVNKLPDKIEINIQVQLSQMQIDLYKSLLIDHGGDISLLDPDGTSKFSSGQLKKFHNLLMQLRKCCNHPYLFPDVEEEGAPEYGEHLVEASGKLMFVDKLLKKIFAQGE